MRTENFGNSQDKISRTSKTWFYKLPAAIFPIFYQKKIDISVTHLVFGMSVFNTDSVFFVRFLYGSVNKTWSVLKTDEKNGRPKEASRGVVP